MRIDLSWLDSVDVDTVPVQVVGWQDQGVWNYPNLGAVFCQAPASSARRPPPGSLDSHFLNWTLTRAPLDLRLPCVKR